MLSDRLYVYIDKVLYVSFFCQYLFNLRPVLYTPYMLLQDSVPCFTEEMGQPLLRKPDDFELKEFHYYILGKIITQH